MMEEPSRQVATTLDSAAWVEAAFDALAEGGIEAVRIDPLAKQLGVTRGSFYWHFTDRAALFADFPAQMNVMHWHGDTFDLPPDARLVSESVACPRQAFVWGDRVVGLQFHLEMGAVNVADLANVAAEDLTPGRYVQTAEQLTQTPADLPIAHAALFALLDALAAKA